MAVLAAEEEGHDRPRGPQGASGRCQRHRTGVLRYLHQRRRPVLIEDDRRTSLPLMSIARSLTLCWSIPRLNELIRGRREVTPDTALPLARVLECQQTFGLGCSRIGTSGIPSGAIKSGDC